MIGIYCSSQTRPTANCQAIVSAARRWLNRQPRLDMVELSIALVGKTKMRQLNHQCRGVNRPCTILTFVYSTGHGKVGDIYINPQLARQKGFTIEAMVNHGLKHCLGQHHR